jgi:hypothetical protein
MHLNIVLSVVSSIIIGSVISDITIALAQLNNNSISQNNSIESNSTSTEIDSDTEQIVVTWLTLNETKPDNSPTIRISSQDFWKIFEPLVEQSID